MAIDNTGIRAAAAATITDSGYLITVRQIVYVDDTRTGQVDRQVYGLLETSTPVNIADNLVGVELTYTMAALDVNGDPLNLKRGDLVSYKGKWVPVVEPNETAPNGVDLLYEPLVSDRKAVFVRHGGAGTG